jgi:hypothetical protein
MTVVVRSTVSVTGITLATFAVEKAGIVQSLAVLYRVGTAQVELGDLVASTRRRLAGGAAVGVTFTVSVRTSPGQQADVTAAARAVTEHPELLAAAVSQGTGLIVTAVVGAPVVAHSGDAPAVGAAAAAGSPGPREPRVAGGAGEIIVGIAVGSGVLGLGLLAARRHASTRSRQRQTQRFAAARAAAGEAIPTMNPLGPGGGEVEMGSTVAAAVAAAATKSRRAKPPQGPETGTPLAEIGVGTGVGAAGGGVVRRGFAPPKERVVKL